MISASPFGFGVEVDPLHRQDGTNLRRDGRGAYEDYVRAGERFRASRLGLFQGIETGEDLRQIIRRLEQPLDPATDDPEDSAARSARLQEYQRLLARLPSGPGRPTTLDIDRAAVKEFLPAWEMVERGNEKPLLPSRESIDIYTTFPEFATFRAIVQLVRRLVRVQLAEGDGAAAVKTYRSAFTFIDNTSHETIIARLVSAANEAILIADLERNLPLLPLSGLPELKSQLLLHLPEPPRFFSGLANERNFLIDVLKEQRKYLSEGNDIGPAILALVSDETPAISNLIARLKTASPAEQDRIFAQIVDRYDARIRAVRLQFQQPERDWPLRDDPETVNRDAFDEIVDAAFVITSGMAQAEATARTRMRLAILALKAREFFWNHKRYPAHLDEFTTPQERFDPLNGQPFQYAVRDGRIELKSAAHPIVGVVTMTRTIRPVQNINPP